MIPNLGPLFEHRAAYGRFFQNQMSANSLNNDTFEQQALDGGECCNGRVLQKAEENFWKCGQNPLSQKIITCQFCLFFPLFPFMFRFIFRFSALCKCSMRCYSTVGRVSNIHYTRRTQAIPGESPLTSFLSSECLFCQLSSSLLIK